VVRMEPDARPPSGQRQHASKARLALREGAGRSAEGVRAVGRARREAANLTAGRDQAGG
jgi:hypothetical protein